MSDSGVSFWFPGFIVSKVFQRAKSLPRCATQGCPWRRARRTRDWIVDLTQATATFPQLPARGDTQSQSRWGYKIYYQCLAFTNGLEDWSARVFAKAKTRFKEVVFTNRVTPQVLTPPLTAVWVQYKPPALKSCSTGYSTRTSSSASTIIWSGSTVTTLAVVYEYEAPAWQPEVAE